MAQKHYFSRDYRKKGVWAKLRRPFDMINFGVTLPGLDKVTPTVYASVFAIHQF